MNLADNQHMIKIVTDSTADVPNALAESLGIRSTPALIEIDGQTYLDNVTLGREQFYRDLAGYRDFPKTAAAPVAAFIDLYRAAKAEGADEVISIHLSTKLSGMYNSARIAAEEAVSEGIRVHVVDSGSVSMGVGWMCILAAQMAQQGAGSAEIVARLNDLVPRTQLYILFDTLKYLRKGGRLGALSASLGDLMQIKLILQVKEGVLTPIDRVRLRSRGLDRLTELALAHGHSERIAIGYGNVAPDKDLPALQQRIASLSGEPSINYCVTPVLGAHFGPGGLGVIMVGT